MGFMGLRMWQDSDNASDLMYDVLDGIGKTLLEEVGKKENCWNTDGCINVALVVEGLLTDVNFSYHKDSGIYKAVDKAISLLQKKLDFPVDEYEKKNIGRMVKNLEALKRNAI